MQLVTKLLGDYDRFSVWEVGLDHASEMTQFVFDVYYRRFSTEHGWDGAEYRKMLADDLATTPHSTVFAVRGQGGEWLAASRVIQRSSQTPLPIEADFSIAADEVCRNNWPHARHCYEAARLAKSEANIRDCGLSRLDSMVIGDTVIAYSVRHMHRLPGSICFASIDNAVLSVLRKRGFPFIDIGETNNDYVGSPTTPVAMSMEEAVENMFQNHPDSCAFYFPYRIAAAA